MSSRGQQIQLLMEGIRVSPDTEEAAILAIARGKMKRAGIPTAALHFRLYKRAVDARHPEDIRLVCSVLCEAEGDFPVPDAKRLAACGGRVMETEPLSLPRGSEPMGGRPVVVGMGPAGMFCALLLAENGYAPILIDRGDCVADRVRAVEAFTGGGVLDTESNIQFGAGGAGTFSDGKLLTRIRDGRCHYVLERLHDFGAPTEILTQAKPHVGTDILRQVVDHLLERVCACGGTVLYRARLDGLEEHGDGSLTLRTTAGDFHAPAVVLAIGNSARDTYRMLIEGQYAIEPKPLSVGVRIEQLQEDIDRALYGRFAGHPSLGHAEYALSDTRRERGVYTFCMCPGGQVIAAASEEGGVVVNGMSTHARDGKNANCALVVSVGCEDYEPVDGSTALGAIAYQRRIEREAFRLGGGDYRAPVLTVGDFLAGEVRHEPSRILPTYGGGRVRLADISRAFPENVNEGLRYGLSSLNRKLHGFACPDAVLTAAETRTSAPVRILRDAEGRALGHPSVYPCGEGAGYAGGITSAAVDGIRTAQSLMARFAPAGEA